MGFLKKSFLVSACLFFCGIHSAWGMKGSSPDGESSKPASSISKIQDSGVVIAPVLDRYKEYENDEIEKYKLWLGRYKQTQQLNPDAVGTSPQDFEEAFATLKEDEKPLPYRGEAYIDDSPKKAASSSSSSSDREDVAYVGPKHMNYIQREDGAKFPPIYEALAVPQEKDPQIGHGAYDRSHQPEFIEVYSLAEGKMKVDEERDKRKLSFDDTDIIFDPGHGIDHAITITHNGSNSTADVRNYTPQNARYNRFIRKQLVRYAEKEGYSYKEIAIYAEEPLLITCEKSGKRFSQPIPEGFVFLLLSHDNTGNIEKAFYFPNFYPYIDDTEGQTKWKFFAQKYSISNDIATDVYGHHEISSAERLRTNKVFSENAGYRTLSGRFEVLPEGKKWPVSARNAFVRTCAIYLMERAAEYDIKTENMLQIAQLFNSAGIYPEFKGSVYIPSLARYWVERALGEVERKGYPAEDVFFFMDYESQIPIKPEEMASVISSFEQKLKENPNTEHIAKLLQYFDEQHNEPKYVYWSHKLSSIVRNREILQSVVINEGTHESLIEALSNTNNLNIILDFEITQDNVKDVIEGFKQRALNEKKSRYKQNLVFLEFPKISRGALETIFHSFEYGIEGLRVDIGGTAVKLPSHDREKVQEYMRKKCPGTRIVIHN